MAKAIPNPEPPLGGGGSARDSRPGGTGNPAGSQAWDKEDLLPKDQQPFGARPAPGLEADAGDATAAAQLQAENTELRSIIADLQQELEAVSGKNENNWVERQKEYES